MVVNNPKMNKAGYFLGFLVALGGWAPQISMKKAPETCTNSGEFQPKSPSDAINLIGSNHHALNLEVSTFHGHFGMGIKFDIKRLTPPEKLTAGYPK